MIFALALMTIGLAVGAAALAETLSSRSHTNLDARERRALQAADFGVQAVLYRQNQLNIDSLDLTGGAGVLGKLAACVVPETNESLTITGTVTVTVTSSGNACPPAEGPGKKGPNGEKTAFPVGNHASYVAEFVPGETVPSNGSGVIFKPKIISIGKDESPSNAAHPAYARVEANLATVDPFKTVEAVHNLTFEVPLAETFNGSARAGHNLTFSGLGAFTGASILGPGGSLIGPATIDYGCEKELKGLVIPVAVEIKRVPAAGECKEPFFARRSISISPSKPSCPSSCSSLTGYVSGRGPAEKANPLLTNENEIYITSGATLKLTPGSDYVFCSFVTNGPVEIAEGSNSTLPVRIFIDSPSSSRCSGFEKHGGITAGSFTATKGIGTSVLSPSQLQIYMVGNGTNNGTKFTSSGGSIASGFLLYAPQTEVSETAPVSFTGTLIGYDVKINTLVYTQDLGLNNYPLSNSAGVFHISGYTQCPANNTSGSAVTELTLNVSTDTSGC